MGRAADRDQAGDRDRSRQPLRDRPGAEQEPKATGIDYLGLIEARRREQLERRIDYHTLADQDTSTAAQDGNDEHDQEDQQ